MVFAGPRLPLRRRLRSQRAFTLVELLVVLLLIGTLISLGFASYRPARIAAYDTEALAFLYDGYGVARIYYTQERERYGDSEAGLVASLNELASQGMSYHDSSFLLARWPRQVWVERPHAQRITLCVQSRSTRVFCLRDAGSGTLLADADSGRREDFAEAKGPDLETTICLLPTETEPPGASCAAPPPEIIQFTWNDWDGEGATFDYAVTDASDCTIELVYSDAGSDSHPFVPSSEGVASTTAGSFSAGRGADATLVCSGEGGSDSEGPVVVGPRSAEPSFASAPTIPATPESNTDLTVTFASSGYPAPSALISWQVCNRDGVSNCSSAGSGQTLSLGSVSCGKTYVATVTLTSASGVSAASATSPYACGEFVFQHYANSWVDRSLWVAYGDGSNAHSLISSGINWGMSSPHIAPDGSKIVFTSDKDPNVANGTKADTDIWTIASSGATGTLVRLTTSANSETNARFSPDGTKILYEDATDKTLRVMDADGSNDHFVRSYLRRDSLPGAGWAADGSRIYYADYDGYQYAYRDSNPAQYGSRAAAVDDACSTNWAEWGFFYGGWGLSTVCARGMAMYSVHSDGSSVETVTSGNASTALGWATNCSDPGQGYCRVWTSPRPDPNGGDVILFTNQHCSGSGVPTASWIAPSSGTYHRRFFASNCDRIVNPTWSPNSTQIAYNNGIFLDPYLKTINVDGTGDANRVGMRSTFDWGHLS